MCKVAAHLADHVLPDILASQWVLSVPKRLRPHLHHDMRATAAVPVKHIDAIDRRGVRKHVR